MIRSLLVSALIMVSGGRGVAPADVSPAWLDGAAAFEWVTFQSLSDATAVHPSPAAPGNVKYVIDAWGGAALRSNGSYYIIHGGGHGDYGGNEIYVISLEADSPAWERIWGPTPNAQIVTGQPYYNDGNPASIHTYHTLHFDNAADVMRRVLGGWYVEPSGMNSEFNSWGWLAENWNAEGTHPDVPVSASPSAGTVIHPTTGDIYYWANATRAIWTKSSNTWTYSDTGAFYQSLAAVLLMDVANNCIWSVGGSNAAAATVYKWSLSDNAISTHSVTGDGTAITDEAAMGGDYSSADGLFYLYSDGVIYRFDPGALTIAAVSMTGTAPQSSYADNAGIWSKFKYVPALTGFAVQPAWAADGFFFKVE